MMGKCVIPVILIIGAGNYQNHNDDYTSDTKTDISPLAFFLGKDVKWYHTLFTKIKIKVLIIFFRKQ